MLFQLGFLFLRQIKKEKFNKKIKSYNEYDDLIVDIRKGLFNTIRIHAKNMLESEIKLAQSRNASRKVIEKLKTAIEELESKI